MQNIDLFNRTYLNILKIKRHKTRLLNEKEVTLKSARLPKSNYMEQ